MLSSPLGCSKRFLPSRPHILLAPPWWLQVAAMFAARHTIPKAIAYRALLAFGIDTRLKIKAGDMRVRDGAVLHALGVTNLIREAFEPALHEASSRNGSGLTWAIGEQPELLDPRDLGAASEAVDVPDSVVAQATDGMFKSCAQVATLGFCMKAEAQKGCPQTCSAEARGALAPVSSSHSVSAAKSFKIGIPGLFEVDFSNGFKVSTFAGSIEISDQGLSISTPMGGLSVGPNGT